MADNFLSQEEVDALLHGVEDDVALAPDADAAAEADISVASSQSSAPEPVQAKAAVAAASSVSNAYAPAHLESMARGRLPKLDAMNDRFSTLFQAGLKKILGRSVEIAVAPVKQSRYSVFMQALPVPSNLNLVHVKPLQGLALVVLEPDLVFLIVDHLFGGEGKLQRSLTPREFTQTEQRIIQRVLNEFFSCYSASWHALQPIEFEFVRAETQARFATIAADNDVVVTTSVMVDLGTGKAMMHLCMPAPMLEPIREQLSTMVQGDGAPVDMHWVHRMSQQLQSAEVELVAHLCEIGVTLGDLMKMQPGDFIPIDMPESIAVYADAVPVMTCHYGISNHQYALRVDQLMPCGKKA